MEWTAKGWVAGALLLFEQVFIDTNDPKYKYRYRQTFNRVVNSTPLVTFD